MILLLYWGRTLQSHLRKVTGTEEHLPPIKKNTETLNRLSYRYSYSFSFFSHNANGLLHISLPQASAPPFSATLPVAFLRSPPIDETSATKPRRSQNPTRMPLIPRQTNASGSMLKRRRCGTRLQSREANRYQEDPNSRRGSHRNRPSVRVRLLRDPSV